MCTYPTKSPWILHVPACSLVVEQLQKVLLSLGSKKIFSPWRGLVDIHKLHFPECQFHLSDNRALCKTIFSHVAREGEHFGVVCSLAASVLQSEKDTVYLPMMSLSLISTALPGYRRVINSQSQPH